MSEKKEKSDEKTNTSKVNVSSSASSSTLQGKPVNCIGTENFKEDAKQTTLQNKKVNCIITEGKEEGHK